jgi:hypothetical protein
VGDAARSTIPTEPVAVRASGATTNGPQASANVKLWGTRNCGAYSAPSSRSRVQSLRGPVSSWIPTTTTAPAALVSRFCTGSSSPTSQSYRSAATPGTDTVTRPLSSVARVGHWPASSVACDGTSGYAAR